MDALSIRNNWAHLLSKKLKEKVNTMIKDSLLNLPKVASTVKPTAVPSITSILKSGFASTIAPIVSQSQSIDSSGSSHTTPIQNDADYMSYTTAYSILGSMMLAILLVLLSCAAFLAFVRYDTEKKGRKEIKKHETLLNKAVTEESDNNDILHHAAPEQSDRQASKKSKTVTFKQHSIEARPQGLASVISFLAENPVNNKGVKSKPANTSFLLVNQQRPSANRQVAIDMKHADKYKKVDSKK